LDTEPGGVSLSIGVVIVTYNSAGHIGPCLDSLSAAASGLALSVVVVDNGSKDGTVGIAREAWPGLRLIEEPQNVGFARAVNIGASVLRDCRYILLLNPDATMADGSLARLSAALDDAPRAAACGPHLRYPDGRHQISARPLPTLSSVIHDALLLYHLMPRPDLIEQFPPDSRVTGIDCLSGACMLIRRDCFDALDGLDERFFLYGEDIDFCARVRILGRTLLLVPDATVVHAEGASAFKDRARFFEEIHRARAQYVRKHFGPIKAALALAAQVTGLALRGVLYSFGPMFGRSDLRPLVRHQWAAIATVLRRKSPTRQRIAAG
jgi:GT2 family glycosyltransferase